MTDEEKKIYQKNYRKQNKENLKNYYKNWYNKNKELKKDYDKKWNIENKQYMKEYFKEYKKTEKGKIIYNNYMQKRRFGIKSGKKVTTKMLQDIIKNQNYKCNLCKCFLDFKIKRFVHLDHIIPLSKGGTHIIENLQYLCQKCNLTKSNKI